MCYDQIKLRSLCDLNATGLFVDDYISVDNTMLSHVANETQQTGTALGSAMLNIAINSAIADITTLNANVNIKKSIDIMKSQYAFDNGTLLSDNKKTTVFNTTNSMFSKIKVTKLKYKPDFNGTFNIYITDGENTQVVSETAISGVETVVDVNFISTAKKIDIYTDSNTFFTIKSTATGCQSCGGGGQQRIFSRGFLNNNQTNTIYNVIPYAELYCDGDDFICYLFKNTQFQTLFMKLVSYNFAIDLYNRVLLSTRFNDTTLNIDKARVETTLNDLTGKHKFILYGDNAGYRGIKSFVQEQLKSNSDYCVNCNAILQRSSAIF